MRTIPDFERQGASRRYRSDFERQGANRRYRSDFERQGASRRYRSDFERQGASRRYRSDFERNRSESRQDFRLFGGSYGAAETLGEFRYKNRHAFTLLEILLALAILGGSLAVLSSIAGTGISAARESRDLAVARILCQTKLSEILLANVTPQPIFDTPTESSDSGSMTPFSYSVEVLPAPLDGLLAVRITVVGSDPDGGPALATYSLTRWMIDPSLGLEAAAAAAEQAAAESAESSGGSGGTET